MIEDDKATPADVTVILSRDLWAVSLQSRGRNQIVSMDVESKA